MTDGWRQSSRVEGEGNNVFQAGKDVRVRHIGDRTNKFSFKGLGMPVLVAAVVAGGGFGAYKIVQGAGANPSDAVGTWSSAPSGSAADLPATLTVGPDGAFDLRMKVVFNLGQFGDQGLPEMEVNCSGVVEGDGERLLFTTTSGPCGEVPARVKGDRLTLDVSSDQGKQTMTLVKTMTG
ncbi:hypothetical protein AB0A74_19935 [Saccharothrix sp. NPDC042600]|uniref:hypothetical protein n=1 Tax=Saccharothrix TaxID=2071 RepID=UPI0033FEFADA|nr:hypothetical protein GCM10017745_07140 [Saccharothrix mutabilis subsp. capreolus]